MEYYLNYNIPVGEGFDNPVPITNNCLVQQAIKGTTTQINYESQVEPYIAVNPCDQNNIVVVWKQSRISNGGSLTVGLGYTYNGGRTWR